MSLSREIDGSRRSRSEGCRRRGGISILIRRGANTTVQLPQGRRGRGSGRAAVGDYDGGGRREKCSPPP